MNHTTLASAVLGLFPVLFGASLATPSASYAEPCGTVVAAGTTLALTSDVGPCDGIPSDHAITVEEGGTLDLNGKTVSCQDLNMDNYVSSGIALTSGNGNLSNGTVEGCAIGVGLSGNGHHVVNNVTVENSGDGFVMAGSRNKLTSCVATGNSGDGFVAYGYATSFSSTSSTGNGGDGYRVTIPFVVGAGTTKFLDTVASGNGGAGFYLYGKIKLNGGSAASNHDGVIAYDDVSIGRMTIASNTNYGIDISWGKVRDNIVSGNAYGIRLEASTAKAKVVGNNSSLNSTFDMDEELGCGDHKWIDNTFATSNDPCIQ